MSSNTQLEDDTTDDDINNDTETNGNSPLTTMDQIVKLTENLSFRIRDLITFSLLGIAVGLNGIAFFRKSRVPRDPKAFNMGKKELKKEKSSAKPTNVIDKEIPSDVELKELIALKKAIFQSTN